MKVTEITVSAGRVFNHPFEQYSNLKPHITLKATLSEGEDAEAAAKQLQQTAEKLVEDHKRALLTSIEELDRLQRAEQELADLGRTMATAQAKIDRLRKENPILAQKMLLPADANAPTNYDDCPI